MNDGTISIDGTDIKDINLQSLRGLMGLVTQDSILFNGQHKSEHFIRDNKTTDDEIIMKIANVYEFCKSIPPKAGDTTDDGIKLCGKQRSIARAVLKTHQS
jgi:subfamily B ATP-binding cassette protein MsbA